VRYTFEIICSKPIIGRATTRTWQWGCPNQSIFPRTFGDK
jgi:hypothetical protein